MSLIDLVLPSREQQAQKQGESQKPAAAPPPTSSSYTHQPPPPPKVQSRDSMDSAVYNEFYAPPSPELRSHTIISKKRKMMEDPPALPQRSALRRSRVLDNINISSKIDSHSTPMSQSTPHDVYMSSEEEASSSADDFSDYDFEEDDEGLEDYGSSSGESQKSPVRRRRSHEDTARVVSVVFSGRPSIIDVSTSKRSTSAASVEPQPRTSIASTPESLLHHSARPTTPSLSSPPKPHPPRSSSMMFLPTHKLSKHRPKFLNTDPFPNQGGYELKQPQIDEHVPRTPKTPTAVFKSVSRTLSLVRKRSRPLLNNVNGNAPTSAPNNDSSYDLHRLERSQTPQSIHSAPDEPSTPGSSEFVLYSEPLSRRDSSFASLQPPPPPRTPISPAGTMKGILAMARRRSLHMRAAAARV